MKAAGILEINGSVRAIELAERTDLGRDEVLIDVKAAGVGNWDEIVRTGGWDVGTKPPMALGVEAAGIVRKAGPAVKRFRAGDAVLTHTAPLKHQGAWAEQIIAPEDHLGKKPDGMPWAVAAAFPIPALTASQLLTKAAVRPDELVLVHGGGGITGGLIVALAAGMGARVIATAGSASAQRVRQYGAETVIDYHLASWQDQVRKVAGTGVAVAVNAVRGGAAALTPLVADEGRLVTITGDPPDEQRDITVINVYVTPDGPALEKLATEFTVRELTIPISASYGLAAAGAALTAVTAGRAGGAMVIDPSK